MFCRKTLKTRQQRRRRRPRGQRQGSSTPRQVWYQSSIPNLTLMIKKKLKCSVSRMLITRLEIPILCAMRMQRESWRRATLGQMKNVERRERKKSFSSPWVRGEKFFIFSFFFLFCYCRQFSFMLLLARLSLFLHCFSTPLLNTEKT